mgnify:CR=1 FL=1
MTAPSDCMPRCSANTSAPKPMAVVSAVFQRFLIRAGREARRLASAMTASYGEMLLGARTTKTLAREDANLAEFQQLSGEMNMWAMRGAVLSSVYMPLMAMLAATAGALVLWQGAGWVLADEKISLGTLIAFMQFAALFAQPVQELAQRFADILNASSAAERIASLLATEPAIADAPNADGTIVHPMLGAWAQHYLGPSHATLPASVSVS